MRTHSLILLFCLLTLRAGATEQIPERLIVGRDTLCMFELPIDLLDSTRRAKFEKRVQDAVRIRIPTESGDTIVFLSCTALWRDYIGTWELRNDTLVFRNAVDINEKLIRLDDIIRDEEPALWYSGEIRAGHGAVLSDAYMGFSSILEYEAFYTIENGVVTGVKHFHNTIKGGKDEYDFAVASELKARKRIWKYISRRYPECKPSDEVWFKINIQPDSSGNPVKCSGEIWLAGKASQGPISGDNRLSKVLSRNIKPTGKLPVFTLYDTIQTCNRTFSYEPIRQILIPDEKTYSDKLVAILREHHPEFRKHIQVMYYLSVMPDVAGNIDKIDVSLGAFVSHLGKRIELATDDSCIDAAINMLQKKKKIPVQLNDGKVIPWIIRIYYNRD